MRESGGQVAGQAQCDGAALPTPSSHWLPVYDCVGAMVTVVSARAYFSLIFLFLLGFISSLFSCLLPVFGGRVETAESGSGYF